MRTLFTERMKVWGVLGWLSALLLLSGRPALAQGPSWLQAFSGTTVQPPFGTSGAEATAVDAAGNVYVTGNFENYAAFGPHILTGLGGSDMFLAKWNTANSRWDWAIREGGGSSDWGYSLAVQGNTVYVGGTFATTATIAGTTLNSQGSRDVFVAKYTDNGSSVSGVWAVSGGGGGLDYCNSIAVSGSNVYIGGTITSSAIIAGTFLSYTGGYDGFVAKYTDNGPTVSNGWAVRGGSNGNDGVLGIAVQGSSVYAAGYYASGTGAQFAGTTFGGRGGSDMFLVKYTDNGTSASNGWAVNGGGTDSDAAYGVAVSGTNVYVTGDFASGTNANIAGTSLPGAGLQDVYLAKYVDNGSTVANGWATTGGGNRQDLSWDIAARGSNVYVTGYFMTGSGATFGGFPLTGVDSYDGFVVKYTDNGSTVSGVWAAEAGSTSDNDSSYGIAVDGTNVYVAQGAGTSPYRAGSLQVNEAGAVLGRLNDATGTWQQLASPGHYSPTTTSQVLASATDASGNIYIAGTYTNAVTFVYTELVSAGATDVFVAKWDRVNAYWAWSTSLGGTGADAVSGLAVNGTSVYVSGTFTSGTTAIIGNTVLTGAGGTDAFLAKYIDNTTSVTASWARSAGGASNDQGAAVAYSGTSVYLAGAFESSSLSAAGATLTGTGGGDMFLAKYTDNGTTAANGWATRAGSTGAETATGLAVNGTSVYVSGTFANGSGGSSTIAGTTLSSAGGTDMFVAKYVDNGTSVSNGWAVRGGGAGADTGSSVSATGSNVFVAGSFESNQNAAFAGTTLAGAGGIDGFVAKYVDNGTTAGNGWAVSGGGPGFDSFSDVATTGVGVYVSGQHDPEHCPATSANLRISTQFESSTMLVSKASWFRLP